MPAKTTDRLAEIRARVARRPAETPDLPDEVMLVPEPDTDDALAAASAHFFGTVEQIIQTRPVQRIPIGHFAPDNRPEMRQARLIPLPEVLLANDESIPAYQTMVDELGALGQSLRERQIQPILVYPGTSSIYPAARRLIMIGHRRWTAASLAGLDALDAVVVEEPTPTERVRIQYAENEAREDFSDMERAWALTQMKQILGDTAPWEAVEEQFRISRTRRHEPTRLLAFTESHSNRLHCCASRRHKFAACIARYAPASCRQCMWTMCSGAYPRSPPSARRCQHRTSQAVPPQKGFAETE
jgi:ParB/RepB/Spo0J family partition protein